jgi:hypothetical protein
MMLAGGFATTTMLLNHIYRGGGMFWDEAKAAGLEWAPCARGGAASGRQGRDCGARLPTERPPSPTAVAAVAACGITRLSCTSFV